jgi:hypothetical protein
MFRWHTAGARLSRPEDCTMKTTTTNMAAPQASTMSSRTRARLAMTACATSWYATATKGNDVIVFDGHPLALRRPKENPQ